MPQPLIAATGPYLEQILEESFPLWGEGLTYTDYCRYWDAQQRTPWGASHLDRVALVEDNAVTSSAKRYDLSARLDGRIRRVLGIGAVFTSPGRRGRGGAQRLLRSMLETAEAEGFEFAMLFSEIERSFYERLDFVPVPLVESRVRVRTGRGAPAVLMRAGDDRDIPAIAEISASRSANARLALDRNEDWIRYGITKRRLFAGFGTPGRLEIEFLVTEEGHNAVAYLLCSVTGTHWYIEDAGDRDPAGARLGAMLQVMLARNPHLEPPDIRGWLPHGFLPPQIEITETAPVEEVLMIKPLQDRTLPLPPIDASDVVYWHADYF